MIRKILKLQNVGLLQDATQSGAVDIPKVCGIYADNGRGKSTFAAVLRACGLGDGSRLNARRTIDSPGSPEVAFLLPTGSQVQYKGNAWSGASPNITVFDSEFVEQNVYSGFEVRAEQRQALLEFALGDQMVQLKQQVDQLTRDIDSQTRRRSQAEKELSGYAAPYSVQEFVALPAIRDAQQQIDALQKRFEAARNIQQISARQLPSTVQSIQIDLQPIFDVLGRQLQDVEQSAEAIVKAHLAKHINQGFEDWVGTGQAYLTGGECPFCAQAIEGLELIQAYRSHFNQAYDDLKQELASLSRKVDVVLADSKVDQLRAASETNTARIEAWKDQIDLGAPVLATDGLRTALTRARESIQSLLVKKRAAPLDAVGSAGELDAMTAGVDAVQKYVAAYNADVSTIAERITSYKKRLAGESVASLQTNIRNLEAGQRRQQPAAKVAAEEYQASEAERKRLQLEKEKARAAIDGLMTTTLQKYQTDINTLLATFGAEFSIEQLKHTSVGSGEPRTEYAINVRNITVRLGSRADLATTPSFATTLSESDKRTLAFAFFLARIKSDPDIANAVVVLDDPVSSLDRNRRFQSVQLIAGLAAQCQQLIVLSHDPYFVRELRECLADAKPTPISLGLVAIKRVQNGYSAFGTCDIDDVCSSDYYRHHQVIADYVDGKSTANIREVAKTVRPLLEGYYYRRFPRRIPRKLPLGQIIDLAAKAQAGDPLAHLQPLLQELQEVNMYAGQFHHDPNPSYEPAPVVDGQLLPFAKRALNLIYQNG